MLYFEKEPALTGVPFGVLEVAYPAKDTWHTAEFQTMVDAHLQTLRERYAEYDRKELFGTNAYFRFFKKFKKTYPVMM